MKTLMTSPSEAVLTFTEPTLMNAYSKYCSELEDLTDEGFDMGRVPTIKEFCIIFKEEQQAYEINL